MKMSEMTPHKAHDLL